MGLNKGYHFSLKISPILTARIEGNGSFTVYVTNHIGSPAPNVNVTIYYFSNTENPITGLIKKSNITLIDGHCKLEFEPKQDYILLVKMEQYGIKVVCSKPENVYFSIKGNNVFASSTPIFSELIYSTGSIFSYECQYLSRYVEVDGSTYIVEVNFWG